MKYKNIIGSIAVFTSAVLIAGMGFAAIAQAADSATLSIATNGGSYAVGQGWTLSLASTLKNANFSLCAINNKGVQSCTPWGTTVADGSWAGTGTFDATTVGSWTEWITFPSQNITSNNISFTVTAASPTPGSCTNLQIQQGTCIPVTSTQPALCTAGFPMNLVPPGGYQHMTIQVCSFGTSCQTETPITYLTLDSANFIGSALGASVVGVNNPLGDSDVTFSGPEYELIFPNGYSIPAGAISHIYELGGEPFTGNAQMSGNALAFEFTQIQQSICGPGPATTSNSGGATNSGVTTGGSVTTGTGASTGKPTASGVNTSLNSALSGFSSSLSTISAATGASAASSNTGTGSGVATGSTSGSTSGSATGSSSSNICASTAATTIASSLQTLQGLAGVLSSGSTSPGILTSIQNLINAVAQVLSSLASCINSQ